MNDKKIPSQKAKDEPNLEIPQQNSTNDESEIIGLQISNANGDRVVPDWIDTLNKLPPEKAKLLKKEMEELNKNFDKSIKEKSKPRNDNE